MAARDRARLLSVARLFPGAYIKSGRDEYVLSPRPRAPAYLVECKFGAIVALELSYLIRHQSTTAGLFWRARATRSRVARFEYGVRMAFVATT